MSRSHILGLSTTLLLVMLLSCVPQSFEISDSDNRGAFSIEGQEKLKLDGQWRFVFGQLLDPFDPKWEDSKYVTVPVYWNQIPERDYPPVGLGSFQTKIILPQEDTAWGVYVQDINTAYRIYANEELLGGVGEVSSDLEEVVAMVHPEIFHFNGSGEITITIQVANAQDNFGGIRHSITLGPLEEMQYELMNSWAWDSFFSGAMLVLGIYHLVLFSLYRKRGHNLFLAVNSFIISLRTFLVGQRLIYHWFEDLGFELLIRLEFLTVFPLVIFFTLMVRELYPELWEQWWGKFILFPQLIISSLYTLVYLFLPVDYMGNVFRTYDYILVLTLLTITAMIISAAFKKKEGAWLMLIGFLVVSITAINDILYARSLITTGFILTPGLLTFMLVQSIILSIRSAKAFFSMEHLNTELQKLSNMKERFWSRTTHEIRTPLHGILGLADSLIEKASMEDQTHRYHLGLIRGAAIRLNNLTDRLLENSQRIRQEIRPAVIEVIELGGLVDLVAAALQTSSSLTSLNIRIQPARKEIKVQCDPHGLERLLFDLLDHGVSVPETLGVSLSFPDVKSKTLSMIFHPKDNAPEDWYPWKGPTGTDFFPELIQRGEETGASLILEKNQMGEWCISIGLMVKEIRSLMEPLTGQNIPLMYAEEFPAQPGIPTSLGEREGAKILVVDDEPINIVVLETFLKAKNYRILKASSGMQALEILSEQSVDLVLLDVMMPGMSGYETCSKIREQRPDHELPVILLTAKNSIEDLVTGFSVGANDFITKPFHKLELSARLEVHLKLASLTRAYSKFVPKEFLSLLGKEHILQLDFGDHRETPMTVMFLDIRNFTSLSENLSPEENFRFLNSYLSQISPKINSNKGFIDKYLGDGIMALFPSHPSDAVRAAKGILNSIDEYNKRREEHGLGKITVGMGIHTGQVIMGTVGYHERMEGTVISDTVNVAARLEAMTKDKDVSVLFSDTLLQFLDKKEFSQESLGTVKVKGRMQPIEVYTLK